MQTTLELPHHHHHHHHYRQCYLQMVLWSSLSQSTAISLIQNALAKSFPAPPSALHSSPMTPRIKAVLQIVTPKNVKPFAEVST